MVKKLFLMLEFSSRYAFKPNWYEQFRNLREMHDIEFCWKVLRVELQKKCTNLNLQECKQKGKYIVDFIMDSHANKDEATYGRRKKNKKGK